MLDSLVVLKIPLPSCSRGVKGSGRSNKESLVSPAHSDRFKNQLDRVLQWCPGALLCDFFRPEGLCDFSSSLGDDKLFVVPDCDKL